jgi:hypothetical protein
MNYHIRAFNKVLGHLYVEFEGFGNKAINVPINEDGLYITGTELDEYIKNFIPEPEVKRRAALEAGIPNWEDIQNLVPEPEQQLHVANSNPVIDTGPVL